MKSWGFSKETLKAKGALLTAEEIYRQPVLWRKVYDKIKSEKKSISEFLIEANKQDKLQVILTGAGSSAFIGLSLLGVFARNLKHPASAISTTDIVTHPLDFFSAEIPLLLISFARSGNSPESVAAAAIADQICSQVFHLIITCDASGSLANYKSDSRKYILILPAEANDQSLAMTGSYSGMLLSGLLIARLKEIDQLESQVTTLQFYAGKLLDEFAPELKSIAQLDFQRAVFLGSGPLYGTATEAHLKLQELTDGKIICKNDSFLGFRHGPKAVIDEKTLVFFLFSNQSYVWQYERDLMESIGNGKKALYVAGLMEIRSQKYDLDKAFVLSDNGSRLDEDFLPVCCILPGQILGFFKSIQLGLSPDSPSVSGAISRVVKGVVIYPFNDHLS